MNFITVYYPQMDGKNQSLNQVLEDMLRMYVMDKPGKWEDYLNIVKFSYNNNFQVWVGMGAFEIMYGCKCNTPISWSSPVNRFMLGPKLLKDMELTVKQVQQNLKDSQDNKKSYADLKRTPRELQVG